MAIILRLRDVPPALQSRLQEAIEGALDGDWCVTLSQSHIDGQWHLQLDGASERYRVVLPALEAVRPSGLRQLLRRLVESDSSSRLPSGPPAMEGNYR